MNLKITHRDNSVIRLHIKEINSYQRELKAEFYDADGFYQAGNGFKILTDSEDIKRQIRMAHESGSEVMQITDGGQIIDYRRIIL